MSAPAAVIQGSAAWHAERLTGLGSSDAPVVMAVSPWKTPHQLWLEKTGRVTDERDNQAMKRGRDLEAEAREAYELEHAELMAPIFLRHPDHEWAIASLDGLSPDGKTVLEIKCPGAKDHALAKAGVVPEKYGPQLQHQLFVTGADRAHYWSYDGDDGVLVVLERDETYIQRLKEAEEAFWDLVCTDTEPPLTERETVRGDHAWMEAAAGYLMAKQQAEALLADAEDARQALIALLGEAETAAGCGVRVTRYEKAGSVDWQKFRTDVEDVTGEKWDTEKYRKAGTMEVRVTVERGSVNGGQMRT